MASERTARREIRRRIPGEDVPVERGDDLSVIQAVRECMKEADSARRTRLMMNRENFDTYMGVQDFSHKIEGQSSEFLPKTSLAVEQFSAFVKRALVQFGRWFQYQHGRAVKGKIPLTEENIEAILLHYLDNLPDGEGKNTSFGVRMGDAAKVGALESLMILKVYGQSHKENSFRVEMGDVVMMEQEDGTFAPSDDPMEGIEPVLRTSDHERWRLHIDLIKPEDYYPDPSGEGLYEIHRTERDLSYVNEMAELGMYDKETVALLNVSVRRKEEERRKARMLGQDESQTPSFRKKVVIDEFWGTIVNSEGKIARKNCLCTIANDQFLIRKPMDNPNWHGESPFVVQPITRVPWSTWHKALFDPASALNKTLNEVFNLILDGGLASVWGIKQLRVSELEDPSQVSGGIPQGKTLFVKETMPINGKVLENITTGQVPAEALAVFSMVNSEFLGAALSSELKLGSFPNRKVLATEVASLDQAQSSLLDSIASDIEQMMIQNVLRKSWLCILQNLDVIEDVVLENRIGPRAALFLLRTDPVMRFSLLARNGAFRVSGLSAVLTKARDFQKLAALLQLSQSNPILLQAFIKRFSGDKVLSAAMKMLNLNPEDYEKNEEELMQAGNELDIALRLGGGQSKPQGLGSANTGESQLPAEINQAGNPISGMSAAG